MMNNDFYKKINLKKTVSERDRGGDHGKGGGGGREAKKGPTATQRRQSAPSPRHKSTAHLSSLRRTKIAFKHFFTTKSKSTRFIN